MRKFETQAVLSDTVTLHFEGDSVKEYEEDIRTKCLFAERCGLDPIKMMRDEVGMKSTYNLTKELRKVLKDPGFHLFTTPETDLYRKLYDAEKHKFKPGAPVFLEGEIHIDHRTKPKVKDKAAPAKAEEGTVHLSSDMTEEEFADAAKKGSVVTIDLEDFDDMKAFIAEAKKPKTSKEGGTK